MFLYGLQIVFNGIIDNDVDGDGLIDDVDPDNTDTDIDNVSVSSLHGANSGAFNLLDDKSGLIVNYSVSWDDDDDASDGTTMIEGSKAIGYFKGNTTEPDCGKKSNAAVEITLKNMEVAARLAESYKDVLTIFISPA